MPLLKFLKSLGKKRKKKDVQKGKDDEEEKEKEKVKRSQADTAARQPSIDKDEGMIPPQIHGQAVSSPVTARLGDSLSLTISVKGVPPPTVKWFYGTKEIKPCKEFRLKDDGLQYSLLIPKVTESLGKKGICISARNRLGEVKRRVDLKVYRVYSSRRHQALSDSETAKSPDSILFRKKRKLKLIRPRSSPTLVSDSSGPEDEGGHIAYISTDSVVDDVVYETIRSSARHVEPPRLKPRKPPIYTDSSLYETYIDYRSSASKTKKSTDEVDGDEEIDIEGAIGGGDQPVDEAEMLNPRSWQPDPDYATIEDIRRRRQSPATDRRSLTWRGVKSPSKLSELDSRRGQDDDDVTYRSLQYDIQEDGSSDSRNPASTASENPYGSIHIASETPYSSLQGTSERNYGILKPARTNRQPTQDDHLKTESDNFDGYADISDDGSPYSTGARPIKKTSGGARLHQSTVNGYNDLAHDHHQGPPPRASPHEAVNQLWAAQAESARNYNSQPPSDPAKTLPKLPYQDDYCGYMGRQQGLHPFFADDIENRYSYLPGMDIRNNPHAKSSDYDYSDHGYGTMRSTATDVDSLTRGRSQTRSTQNEYLTYGQARQAMRFNSLGRHPYCSPIGGPYGMNQMGRESGYESGYLSGLANSESHYGIITFPPRQHNTDGGSATFPRRSQSENSHSTRATPAPVKSLNPLNPPSPHAERFFYRESFHSPASSPMSSPRIGRQPSHVKQTTEILTMIKKVSPMRSKSLDRDSPLRSLPDVLSSQSPRVQSVVGTNFAEPIVTRLTSGVDVTDSRLTEVTPDPVPAISQPSDGPVISPPVTRRPPIPMSSTIIRSKSTGPGVRYSSLRNRSPSPVRRSTQIRTYDITPTPSRFESTAVKSITAGKPATSTSVKTVTSSVSSHLPSPPSYTSIQSSTPLQAAPKTRFESETPKVTSTIETVTETEHVFIPMKAFSVSSSVVTSLPSQTTSSSNFTSSVKGAKTGTKTVTTTNVNGGKISTQSTYISPCTSSTGATSVTDNYDAGKASGKPLSQSVKGKGKILVEEKNLTEKETKFEFHSGNMTEIFQGISDTLNSAMEGGSFDSTDLSSIANSPLASGSPQHNLSTIINEFTANSGGFPTLDRSFIETMRSTLGDPEQLMRSFPENIQTMLRSASCTGQNGRAESPGKSAPTSSSDKDSDKEIDESLSKIGKEDTNPDFTVVSDCSSSAGALTFSHNNTNCMGIDKFDFTCVNDTLRSSYASTDIQNKASDLSTKNQTSDNDRTERGDNLDCVYGQSNGEVTSNGSGTNSELQAMQDNLMSSRDKFLQDVSNKTDLVNQDGKVKEVGESDLEDDVFEEQNADDAEVSLALDRSAAAFSSIEKGALEGILDLSIVNDILQFSDITSEDVLDDDEIEELSQLIIANISDDVRKEIEKDITIKDYVKSVISQACANLQQASSNEVYPPPPGDGSKTPDHLEGTFYEMEIIDDEEDDKLGGPVSPRFLLPPRYDVDCESDQLSAITEEDDEDMMKVEDIPKDDEAVPDDTQGNNDETDANMHDENTCRGAASPSVFNQSSPDIGEENGVQCIGIYVDDVVINADDVVNGNDLTCIYEVSSKFKCIVENYEDKVKDEPENCNVGHNDMQNTNGSQRNSRNGSEDKVEVLEDNSDNVLKAENDAVNNAGSVENHSGYHIIRNVKEITTTYDIQLVPIPIETCNKSGQNSHMLDRGKTTMAYPEYGIDLEIEVSNQAPESKAVNQSKINHHDYKTHAQANGIQERLQLMHDDYNMMNDDDDHYCDDDDEDDSDDETDDETGMEYDLNDICDVLGFCGDPEFQEALEDCLHGPSFGEESPLDTPSDGYGYNGAEDDLDPNNRFGYADDQTCQVEDNYDNGEQTLSIDSGMDSRASMMTSLASRNSERESPESCTDSNMISKDVSGISESWITTVTKVKSPRSDYFVCDIAPSGKYAAGVPESSAVPDSIVMNSFKRDPESSDEVFDNHIECPKDPPILKPITRIVDEVGDSRIEFCDNAVLFQKGLKRKMLDDDVEFDEHLDIPKEAPILKPITKMVDEVHETRVESSDALGVSKSKSQALRKYAFDEHIDCPKDAPILPITRVVEDVDETHVTSDKSCERSVKSLINAGISFSEKREEFDEHMDTPMDTPILKPITKVVKEVHEPRIQQVNKSLRVLKSKNCELVMDNSDEFDNHIDIPREEPILKPITKIAENVNATRSVNSASDTKAIGASKNQATSFVMLKNFFRIHVPKEVLSSEEKLRFAATISQSDVSVTTNNNSIGIQDAGQINNDDVTVGDSGNDGDDDRPVSKSENDSDDDMNDAMAEQVVNMLDDPSIMAGITEAVQAESSSGDAHSVEAACSTQFDQQGEEEMRVIWHAHGLWDELKRNVGSFMLLLIAVILMQIVNHWLSVEGKED